MIEIVAYADHWTGEFMPIGSDLRRALGEQALRIDHIGVTSVPALAAKDVIDIQVTMRLLLPFDQTQQVMETKGYSFRPKVGYNLDHSRVYFARHTIPHWRFNM